MIFCKNWDFHKLFTFDILSERPCIYLWTKQHILHPTKRKVHFCTKVVLGKSKVFTQQQFRSFNIETHLNMYVKLTLSPQFNVFKKLYFGNSKSFPLEAHVFQWRSIFMEKKQMCTFYIHFLNISFLWQNFGLWMTFVPWIEIYFHTHHREQSVQSVEHTSFLRQHFPLNSDLFSDKPQCCVQTQVFFDRSFSGWHLFFDKRCQLQRAAVTPCNPPSSLSGRSNLTWYWF